MAKSPRRKCANKECRQWFHPTRSEQIVCSYECASAYGKEQTRKAREDAHRRERSHQRAIEKKERAAWRQRKAAVKPLKHWEDLTQRVVNDYIRERDVDLSCISCGTFDTVQWEAGHYRSRGKASHLRYNEDNISKQCHHCNVQLSGNQQQYRLGLIEKIGAERVEALENNDVPHRYTIEELEAIRKRYSALRRGLIKSREAA
ncbi:recombination protein NinG [Kluyvera sp. NPDC087067]|uniref:recombination protein NinG n=1 Tax=Kluyvera sp. NPDC087067 TaxID=3364105 RepID=UPI0038030D24